jgi:hypothetical protein
MLRTLLLGTLLLSAVAAQAADCPFAGPDVDDGLTAAPTCKAAARLLSDCALGASGDVARGGIVREKCERDFLPGLGPKEARAYRAGLARCARKYAKQEGSMYRSMAAFCAVELAERYSARALRKGRPTRR